MSLRTNNWTEGVYFLDKYYCVCVFAKRGKSGYDYAVESLNDVFFLVQLKNKWCKPKIGCCESSLNPSEIQICVLRILA